MHAKYVWSIITNSFIVAKSIFIAIYKITMYYFCVPTLKISIPLLLLLLMTKERENACRLKHPGAVSTKWAQWTFVFGNSAHVETQHRSSPGLDGSTHYSSPSSTHKFYRSSLYKQLSLSEVDSRSSKC